MSYQERVANACIGAERADLVLAGCAILEAIRRAFPCRALRIADRGLREGILVQMMREDGVGPRVGPAVDDQARNRRPRRRRVLKARVKTASSRTLSSKLWLERQLNDPYVTRAKREGYRSRAAFKLARNRRKAHILKQGGKVVDLGAAPGGWSQVAAKRIGAGGAARPRGRDRSAADGCRSPASNSCQLDFLDPSAPEQIESDCSAGPPMWCSPTWRPTRPGTSKTDQLKIMALVEAAAEFAREIWRRAARFSPRCCKAAPRRRCSPRSSAISPA